ncbi:MAG: VTT domain-containing protein [Rhodocyclaceae bacterium]|nr:VTT domain-containing protein [Rhodocyclaceae bacterium]
MMHELVTLIGQYGVLMIFVVVLLEQVGLPLPAVPALVVAGALAADGQLLLPLLFGAAMLACIIGDAIWYAAGRRYGNRVLKTLCRVSLSPDFCVTQARANFDRWGMGLVVIAKFVPGLSTVVPPLAGAMRVEWRAFFLFDGIGAMLWSACGLGAGYVMHAQVAELLSQAERLGLGALILVAVTVIVHIAAKWWQRRQMNAMLRSASIHVDELHALMNSEVRPLIVDFRSHQARRLDPRTIPGAKQVELRAIPVEVKQPVQPGQDVIIFSTCPNEAGAALAAQLLMERGYARVRPLQGGFEAWTMAGHDVQTISAVAA